MRANKNKKDRPKRTGKQKFLHAVTVFIACVTIVTFFAGAVANMF